jgi:succinate dehydrogenase flavin-adding protein (antitoxin of CptAB toxin-antitoxin module)
MLKHLIIASHRMAGSAVSLRKIAVTPTISTTLLLNNGSTFNDNTKRYYRGETSDAYTIPLNDDEMKLYLRAKPRSDEILKKHRQLPDLDLIPDLSWDPNMLSIATASSRTTTGDQKMTKDELELDIRRKRLIYRSKQRGWLEVDLLLGTFANENVNQMNIDELNQFEDFINYETIDIYNIMTLRIDIPDHLKTPNKNSIIEKIQQWVKTSPLGKADPEMYKKMKHDANLI